MKALLRKDADWLLAFAILGSIALAIAHHEQGFVDLWVLPLRSADAVYVTAFVAAGLLGITAAIRDEFGTRDYLLHRPIAPTRILTAKLAGCALVMATWFVVPVVTLWASGLWDGFAPFGRPTNVIDLAVLCSIMPAAFAVGLFAGTLPGCWATRFGALVVVTGAHLAAIECVIDERTSRSAWLALHTFVTLGLVAASYWHVGRVTDVDHEPEPRTVAQSGVVLVASTALVVVFGLAQAQREVLRELDFSRPIYYHHDGRSALVVSDEGVYYAVDEQHRRTGETLPRTRDTEMSQWWHRTRRSFELDTPRFRRVRPHYSGSHAAMLVDGRLHVAWRASWRQIDSVSIVDRDGAPFSDAAHVLRRYDTADVWVADADALWRVPEGGDEAERHELPGGDKLVDQRYVRDLDVFETLFGTDALFVLVGENGVYVLGDEIVAAPAEIAAKIEPGRRREPLQPRILNHDLLEPKVRFATDGRDPFEHTFALHTSTEHAWAALARACSALRPPIFAVRDWIRPESEALTVAAGPLGDPLVVGRKRTLSLVIAIGLGLLAAWRLNRAWQRRGASPASRRIWTACCVLFGPATLLAATALDRKRAHIEQPVHAPRTPWIVSPTTD